MLQLIPIIASMIASACFIIIAVIFATYNSVVLRNPKKTQYLRDLDEAMKRTLSTDQLPKVSLLMAMHNEEKVISQKLSDVRTMGYPPEKLEVLVVDDCSTDGTLAIAEERFRELGLHGKIIKNTRRVGINECFNIGMKHSMGDLIATTGADIVVEPGAMIEALKVLKTIKDVGGVSGKPIPVSRSSASTIQVEKSYRDFYDSMCVAESAIHSTFPAYTGFALIDRSAFTSIPADYGSTDGNLSLGIIRRGLRFICVPSIVFYEQIADSLSEQMKQKTRRASRTIQSAWANRDLLFRKECGSFGSVIFPLRLLMITLVPLLAVIGSLCALVAAVYVWVYGPLFLVLLAVVVVSTWYVGYKLKFEKLGLLYSLGLHECYLLLGLLLSPKKQGIWGHTNRDRSAIIQLE
jgi:cellulose synthase/poly-beta-1,6-N-acetylglucosamine synthase-like glycosyltransferase